MYIPIFYYLFIKCVSSLVRLPLIFLHPTALSFSFFVRFNVTCVRGELIKKKKKNRKVTLNLSPFFFRSTNPFFFFFFSLFHSSMLPSNNALNNKEIKETNKWDP